MTLATRAETIASCFVRGQRPLRTLVVAAHPDDEIVGLGGHLRWLARDLMVVHATDGVPPWGEKGLAAVREREARAALALGGVPFDALVRMHYEDQRLVDYVSAFAERLRDIIALHEPELVLSAPFEGGHPDHDAGAWGVAAALAELSNPPEHWEWASYNAGENGELVAGEFIGPPADVVVTLSAEAAALKKQMLTCHASQSETLALFDVGVERFRRAPRYDFTQRPAQHLFYESRSWGVTFESFSKRLDLARTAL